MAHGMLAPQWAQSLLEEVAATHGVSVPRLRWRQMAEEESSGHYTTRTQSISIKAGSDPVDAHMVVLHEMAHHLDRSLHRIGSGHGEAFYFICWALYVAYAVPLDRAVAREFQYMAAAEKVLRKLGLRLDARGRKAARYGDMGRELKVLASRLKRLRANAASASGNTATYSQRAGELAVQVGQVEQARQRLKAEWQASA